MDSNKWRDARLHKTDFILFNSIDLLPSLIISNKLNWHEICNNTFYCPTLNYFLQRNKPNGMNRKHQYVSKHSWGAGLLNVQKHRVSGLLYFPSKIGSDWPQMGLTWIFIIRSMFSILAGVSLLGLIWRIQGPTLQSLVVVNCIHV